MRHVKEEPPTSPATDIISAVKELHRLNSQELHRLLRDSENFTVTYLTDKGSLIKVDMEKLAGSLPLHLIAVLISSNRDEKLFKYLLCGLRLLHSLFDISPRHSKLEQIMLDDVKVLEQLIDLVFYMLVVIGGYRQEEHSSSPKYLVYSALVACSLYLLTGFISAQWQDLVHVLIVHPKVDLFMDAAFGSVRMVVRCLEISLSDYQKELSKELFWESLSDYQKELSWESCMTSEQLVYHLCQQCEASLQFLQSLCQQKLFKERLLKNKELCGKGSILFLAQSILKLNMKSSFPTKIMAAISRLKAKILSILLSLCEAESISYLDEVASSSQSLNLAKSVASEVFDLLKTAFGGDPGHIANDRSYPMGFLQLNAMRLADIFSDDSNFRSYMTNCFTKVLTAIFSLSHGDFLSCWCSSDLPEKEEDATLEYDIFATVGWILDNSLDLLNATPLELNLTHNSMPQASYAHHRTSLFVKVIANLHCFVPNICEEQERNLFVIKVQECLQQDLSSLLPGFCFPSDYPKAATACKNLRSLLSHAESLTPNFLNEEDVQLLRVFFGQLQSLLSSIGSGENHIQKTQDNKVDKSLSLDKFSKLNINEHYQEAQSTGRCSSDLLGKETTDLNDKSSNLKEGVSENSTFPGVDQVNSRDVDTSKGNDMYSQDPVEDKGTSVMTASGGAVEMDKDTQNVDTSGSDTSSAKGKNVTDHMDNVELSKSSENVKKVGVGDNPEDEKVDTVQRRKRKRNIMNDKQVTMIERALLDEPEMQRNAAALQLWADKLSLHGSEVTSSQLKNWLNNRKARLARTARDVKAAADATDNSVLDKQRGQVGSCDSPDSPSDASNARKDLLTLAKLASADNPDSSLAEVDGGPPEF